MIADPENRADGVDAATSSASAGPPSIRIGVFTIFPELIVGFCNHSLLGRAQERGVLKLEVADLRSHGLGAHRSVDDSPFGGGAGMVMRPDVVVAAVESSSAPRPVFALGPGGRTFDQRCAEELAATDGFSLLCGRYEGIDQRAIDLACDDEFSLGDMVLGGGEVAALAIIESVTRLIPTVMGNAESGTDESFSTGLLEYPHYTRPAEFRGIEVPEVLRSGDHSRVRRWREAQSLARTIGRRPDLIDKRGGLTDDDRRLLAEFGLGCSDPVDGS